MDSEEKYNRDRAHRAHSHTYKHKTDIEMLQIREDPNYKNIAKVVQALASNKDLDQDTSEAVENIYKASSSVSYKIRAKDAIMEAGLTPGRDHHRFQLAPATSHTNPCPPKTIIKYLLTYMTRSRLRGSYRSMIGLDQNDETCDTQSAVPPPQQKLQRLWNP